MLTELLDALQAAADAGDFANYGATQSLEEAIDMLAMVADELHASGQTRIAADLRHVTTAKELDYEGYEKRHEERRHEKGQQLR